MARDSTNREQFRPDDHDNEQFLLTSVVGSYPKPTWLNRADDLAEDPESSFDEDDLEEAHDDSGSSARSSARLSHVGLG